MYPVAWIVWATGAAFVAFSTTNPWYLLPLVGVAWFVHTAHRRDGPWAGSFRMFLAFALVAIALRTTLVLFGTVNASNVVYAALEGLRLGVLLVVFGTFNSVTDPFGVLRLAPLTFKSMAIGVSSIGAARAASFESDYILRPEQGVVEAAHQDLRHVFDSFDPRLPCVIASAAASTKAR